MYDEIDFDCLFGMPYLLSERINETVAGKSVFVQRQDATFQQSIQEQVQIIAVLRIIAYGMEFDQAN